MIVHDSGCHCGFCHDSQVARLRAAFAEEMAGREGFEAERAPRPGTWSALHKAFGPIGKGNRRRVGT